MNRKLKTSKSLVVIEGQIVIQCPHCGREVFETLKVPAEVKKPKEKGGVA